MIRMRRCTCPTTSPALSQIPSLSPHPVESRYCTCSKSSLSPSLLFPSLPLLSTHRMLTRGIHFRSSSEVNVAVGCKKGLSGEYPQKAKNAYPEPPNPLPQRHKSPHPGRMPAQEPTRRVPAHTESPIRTRKRILLREKGRRGGEITGLCFSFFAGRWLVLSLCLWYCLRCLNQ